MAQILKFPTQASKLGYKRVKKRCRAAENPGQLDLDLFTAPRAQILSLESGLSRFEQELKLPAGEERIEINLELPPAEGS